MSSNNSKLGRKTYTKELIILTSLFFIWGFLTNLNTVLFGHLQGVFDLTATQAMLIQFCFFFAYFVMALPSGFLVKRMGYRKGIVVGLAAIALGCIMFYPASTTLQYGIFLGALFILASGITVLQVAANPYVTILGKPETASSRLNFAQALNSIGGTLAPIVGSILIVSAATVATNQTEVTNPLEETASKTEMDNRFAKTNGEATISGEGEEASETPIMLCKCDKCLEASDTPISKMSDDQRLKEAARVQVPYVTIAAILILIAIFFAVIELPEVTQSKEGSVAAGTKKIWQHKHLMFGVLGIFVYVGAEVGIGTMLATYLSGIKEMGGMLPDGTLIGISYLSEGSLNLFNMKLATTFVALYWGGALVGRLLGAVIMQKYDPKKMLTIFGACATLMVILTIACAGFAPYVSFVTIVLVGFFNSIMFPTIFSLSIAGLGDKTSQVSALLNMGIVGGAVIPLLMGVASDKVGITLCFIIPLVCYAYITFFGMKGAKTD